jgi:type IX secretion system PorP/SprF family membrane protein
MKKTISLKGTKGKLAKKCHIFTKPTNIFMKPGVKVYIGLWIVLSCTTLYVKSQVSPLYSKHYNYEQFINPAITGRDLAPVVNLSHKQYWFGTENSPNTTCFGASMRLGTFDFYNPKKMVNRTGLLSKGRMGLGALVMQEKDGPQRAFLAEFTYAYHLPLDAYDGEFSFGLSAQLNSYGINKSLFRAQNDNDREILNLDYGKLFPEAGIGIYFHDAQFYTGASVNDLFLSKSPLYDSRVSVDTRDYFFQAGYKLIIKKFELEPSAYFARIDNLPLYYYSQLKLYFMNYNWFSVGYKSTKSLLFSLGFNIHRVYLAYALEQNISSMGNYYGSSHEVMLGINIGLFQPQGRKNAGRK